MATAKANQGDFLGGGGELGKANSGSTRPTERATTADGLFYLDTGEPTALYHRRMQQNQGLISSSQYVDPTFRPSSTSNPDEYAFDSKSGQYYIKGSSPRIYITNDPAQNQRSAETPTFTINALPKTAADYMPTAQGAAMGGLAGAKLGGVPGAVVGAGFGAVGALPQATGRGLYLTAGDPSQMPAGQRVGTAAEAAQANANYAATGNSQAPGNNYFPQTPAGGVYQPPQYQTMATGTNTGTNLGTNQGASNALSTEAQRVVANAQAMAQQSQARADSFYEQANAASGRAAPQMAMPSSANQQAVYDRAMGFNADSGAAAIRAERADISGAGRLEAMQLDQQGINNLEAFRNTNSQAGVDALNAFTPRRTFASADQLSTFTADNTAAGAEEARRFNPHASIDHDVQALRNYRADMSGVARLNAYADEEQGPSAAQAMLRGQADADKRTMLAIARSGRGAAGGVQALRQAMTEGGLIEAETRGQGAALAAQETEAFQARRLQALAAAGAQISAAEGQRLQAMSQAGVLMSQADQQKLQAVLAYGQLKSQQDALQLSARQSAGQLNAAGEGMKLNATSNAAQLQGDMDQRTLGAIGQAAQLRTAGDQIRSNNLQAAGQIRLAGSEINQRGAIAASQADLQAQALNLQALSLAGNISTEIRNQDITVLRSNLDAQLQTLGLNDQQVRFFNQLGSDREVASQNLQQQAAALGINAQQAQEALNLQWQQFGLSQLTQQQQVMYQNNLMAQNDAQFAASLAQGGAQFNSSQAFAQQQFAAAQAQQNRNNQRQDQQQTYNFVGNVLQGIGELTKSSPTAPSTASAVAASGFQPGLGPTGNPSGIVPQGAFQQVFDPFTNQYVTRPASNPTPTNSNSYFDLAGTGGNSYGI